MSVLSGLGYASVGGLPPPLLLLLLREVFPFCRVDLLDASGLDLSLAAKNLAMRQPDGIAPTTVAVFPKFFCSCGVPKKRAYSGKMLSQEGTVQVLGMLSRAKLII